MDDITALKQQFFEIADSINAIIKKIEGELHGLPLRVEIQMKNNTWLEWYDNRIYVRKKDCGGQRLGEAPVLIRLESSKYLAQFMQEALKRLSEKIEEHHENKTCG